MKPLTAVLHCSEASRTALSGATWNSRICAARSSARSDSTFSSGFATVLNVRAERTCSIASTRLPAGSISDLQLASTCAAVSAKSIFSGTVRTGAASTVTGSSASDTVAAIECAKAERINIDDSSPRRLTHAAYLPFGRAFAPRPREEHFEGIPGQRPACARYFSSVIRLAGDTGLTRCAENPLARERRTSSGPPEPVMATMGSSAHPGWKRRCAASS